MEASQQLFVLVAIENHNVAKLYEDFQTSIIRVKSFFFHYRVAKNLFIFMTVYINQTNDSGTFLQLKLKF